MAGDLLSAMVAASKKVADPIASAYASGNRAYRVKLERPGLLPTFDRDAGAFTNPEDAVLYTGPARIHESNGGSTMDIAGEEMTLTAVTISIDSYTGLGPRIDDLVTVLSNDASIATHLVDRVFTVTGVQVGGHFGIGYVLYTVGVAPSRRT